MTRANTARHAGDVYQARMFWLHAANLLRSEDPVVRVAWESGPRGFDDIRVHYCPPRRSNNGAIHRQYIQCKWHVDAGEFGYEDLIDPKFISADRHSWLSRAYDAYQSGEDGGQRFALQTNWRIRASDPLFELRRSESNELNVKKLYVGKTADSKMGAVRQCWCDHLSIDDDELASFATALTISDNVYSMDEVRERLDDRLISVGLRHVPISQSSYVYDDLITKLHGEGKVDLDERALRVICDREGLWAEQATDIPYTLGIRSFMHKFDDMEHRCDALLDLVPYFDGRFLKPGLDWAADLLPKVESFIAEHAVKHKELRLRVDAHASIAFALGRLLNVKSGRSVEIEQRVTNSGVRFWRAVVSTSEPELTVQTEAGTGEDLVVALSLVHDVTADTRAYCEQHLEHGHRLLDARLPSGPSGLSVADGSHAWRIAVSLAAQIKAHSTPPFRQVHLFAAAPNAVMFFLGQQLGLGRLTTYEFDFTRERGGGYFPAWSLDDG